MYFSVPTFKSSEECIRSSDHSPALVRIWNRMKSGDVRGGTSGEKEKRNSRIPKNEYLEVNAKSIKVDKLSLNVLQELSLIFKINS